MILTRDQIIRVQDRKTVELDVPEWGGSVRIRELSAQDRMVLAFSTDQGERTGEKTLQAMIEVAARALVDEANQPLFTIESAQEFLKDKSLPPLERIVQAVRKLSALSPEDVEEERKNSSETLSADSSSGSV